MARLVLALLLIIVAIPVSAHAQTTGLKTVRSAYIPQGSSTAALREFDDLVLALYGIKKMGQIELEVEKVGKAVKGYKQK